MDSKIQRQWRDKKILIIGCGGLGNGVIMSMSRMGFENFILVDGDIVEISNLHRQWMFSDGQVGKTKVKAAIEWLGQFAPQVKCLGIEQFVGNGFDASQIPTDVDVVVDCTDQVAAKYWIQDYCDRYKKPWVMGSAEQWEGQVSVFGYLDQNGKSWSYRDWVGVDLKDYMVGTCEQRGVFPPVVQWIAQMQVLEVCRISSGLQAVFNGKIGYWNMWTNAHVCVQLLVG